MRPFSPLEWCVRTQTLSTESHTLIMGVLNVTPDSFSDGGAHADTDAAVAAGLAMVAAGADIVDVGGESTRPGSEGVSPREELERTTPVVTALAAAGVVVSIDTSKVAVAEDAIAAGAEIVNDITGLSDPAMVELCADAQAGVVLMHMQGSPHTMQHDPHYDDVVSEVRQFLVERAAQVERAGVASERICIDPGIGFGKTFNHNLELLQRLDALTAEPYPVLLGTSRKGFIGAILDSAGHPTPAAGRDVATGATTALGVAAGAAVFRVHNVSSALAVVRTADAIVRAESPRRTDETE